MSEIIIGSYESVILGYNFQTLEPTFTIKQHNAQIKSLDVNPTTGILASGGHDEQVHLINLKTRKDLGSLISHTDKIISINFNSKLNKLYSTSEDGCVVTWEYLKIIPTESGSAPEAADSTDAKTSKISGKKRKIKPSWEKTSTYKDKKTKFLAVDMHESGKLMLLSDSKSKQISFLNLSYSDQPALAAKKLLGSLNNLGTTVKLIKFDGDNFGLVFDNLNFEYYQNGKSWFRHKSGLSVVHDLLFFQKSALLLGEKTMVENGKRVRYAAIEIVNFSKISEKNKKVESNLKNLYPEGRLKAGSISGVNLVIGDSNGLISVYSIQENDLTLVRKVDSKCRITCLKVYQPENPDKKSKSS